MDLATQRLMSGAAGAGGDKVYVDDLVSITPWMGNGQNSRAIVNNLDYTDGKGLVWIKHRGSSVAGLLHNTVRGASKSVRPASNAQEFTDYPFGTLSSFNNNGFTLATGSSNVNYVNQNNEKFISWGFKAAEKFMDIQVYDGTGSEQRINHDLGVIPYMVIIKRLEDSDSWIVWHNRMTTQAGGYLQLNSNAAQGNQSTYWSSDGTAPNDQVGNWKIGPHNHVNANGEKYLMILFAHNEAVFGETRNKPLCHVYSYTGDGSNSNHVNIGFEPQFTMIKRRDSTGHWYMHDAMRGVISGHSDWRLQADQYDQDALSGNYIKYTPTGFTLESAAGGINSNGQTYLYIAIRRPDAGVGKPVELGTDVLSMVYGNSGGTNPSFVSNFPVDFAFTRQPATSEAWYTAARLIQGKYLFANDVYEEQSASNYLFDHDNGWRDGSAITSYFSWMWKRHAGFDVVAYTGNGSAGHQISHNFLKTPEMIWVKRRSGTTNWFVYHKNLNGGSSPEDYYLKLNSDSAETDATTAWNDTAPTASHFTVGTHAQVNENGSNFLAVLFTSIPGISKLGGYTGTSSSPSVTITTGFSPRFLLIKRIDGVRDWCVFDTVRGIGSGTNDYKLRLNTNAAQSNGQFVDVTSTGFTVQSVLDVGTNGGKYLYYAHA